MKRLLRTAIISLALMVLVLSGFCQTFADTSNKTLTTMPYMKIYASTLDLYRLKEARIIASELKQMYGDSTPELIVFYSLDKEGSMSMVRGDFYTIKNNLSILKGTQIMQGWKDSNDYYFVKDKEIGIYYLKYENTGSYTGIYTEKYGLTDKGLVIDPITSNNLGQDEQFLYMMNNLPKLDVYSDKTAAVLKHLDKNVTKSVVSGRLNQYKLKDYLNKGLIPELNVGVGTKIKTLKNKLDFDYGTPESGSFGSPYLLYEYLGAMFFYDDSNQIVEKVQFSNGFQSYGILIGATKSDMVLKSFGKPTKKSAVGHDELAPPEATYMYEYVSGKFELDIYFDKDNTAVTVTLGRYIR